jgi:hypothetical protein
VPEKPDDWPVWDTKFRDLAGHLPAIRVICHGCDRAGVYRLHHLLARRGPNGDVRRWLTDMSRDCRSCRGRVKWFCRHEGTRFQEGKNFLIEGWPVPRG